MFRFFENLVDPYVNYEETDAPPTRLVPFLRAYIEPFRRVFWLTGIAAVIIAAIEVWLISYLGRLVDILSAGTPNDVWERSGIEFVLVAVFILTFPSLLHIFQVALLNNAILPNIGTLVRWRAHKHVCANLLDGLKMTLQAGLQTGSCKHDLLSVKLYFNCSTRLRSRWLMSLARQFCLVVRTRVWLFLCCSG